MEKHLSWNYNEYTPLGLKAYSERELRKEYSRLRSIARKRLERLEKSEFATTSIVDINKGKFRPLSAIRTEGQLRYLLSDLARFIVSPQSTIRGQRARVKQTVRTLQERGYTFVTPGNFHKFTQFMDEMRRQKLDRLYDSERVIELFESIEKRSIDPDLVFTNFQEFLEKQEEISKIPERVNGKKISKAQAEDMLKKILKYGKKNVRNRKK